VRYRVLVVLGVLLLASCEAAVSEPETTSAPETSADPLATTSSTSAPVDGRLAEVRDLAFAYWEAFNAYDAQKVLSYLEAGYRAEREEAVQEEIDQLGTFGVKLDISELSPPVLLGSDRAEMFVEMKEPLGTRRIRMGFLLVEGAWLIDYAEESE
jgi:hypothetical protein